MTLISSYIILIPLMLGIYFRSSYSDKPVLTKLLDLIMANSIVQILALIIGALNKNNMPLYQFYIVLELYFILRIFKIELPHINKKVFNRIFLFFTIGAFILSNFKYYWFSFPSINRASEVIIILFFCFTFYHHLLKDPKIENLFSDAGFQIISSFFLFYASTLILYIVGEYVQTSSKELSSQVWSLHSVLNIIFYLLMSIIFYVNKRPRNRMAHN